MTTFGPGGGEVTRSWTKLDTEEPHSFNCHYIKLRKKRWAGLKAHIQKMHSKLYSRYM
jgi:hypothetical protein